MFKKNCDFVQQTWTCLDLPDYCKYLQSPIAQLEVDKKITLHAAMDNETERFGTNHLIFWLGLNGKVIHQTVNGEIFLSYSRYLI